MSTGPRALTELPAELLLSIFSHIDRNKLADVSAEKTADVCKTYGLNKFGDESDAYNVGRVVYVHPNGFGSVFGTCKLFATILLPDAMLLRDQYNEFFMSCEQTFWNRFLADGVGFAGRWYKKHVVLLLGGHSVTKFTLESNHCFCNQFHVSVTVMDDVTPRGGKRASWLIAVRARRPCP